MYQLTLLLIAMSATSMGLLISPVTKHLIRNRIVYLKRDDLNTYQGISGNKVRKLWHLIERIQKKSCPQSIVSFGGYQSNAMLALSQLAHHSRQSFGTDCQLTYLCPKIPNHILSNPVGNLKAALALGMKVLYGTRISVVI